MRKYKIAAAFLIISLICLSMFSASATAFYDVADDFWAAPYITSLEARGIVSGYGDGFFLPNNNVQRCEYAKMLVNAEGIPLSSARTSPCRATRAPPRETPEYTSSPRTPPPEATSPWR